MYLVYREEMGREEEWSTDLTSMSPSWSRPWWTVTAVVVRAVTSVVVLPVSAVLALDRKGVSVG